MKNLKQDKKIYKDLMKVKSIIDSIAELKSLSDDHDLCLASNHIDNVLNALEFTQKKDNAFKAEIEVKD